MFKVSRTSLLVMTKLARFTRRALSSVRLYQAVKSFLLFTSIGVLLSACSWTNFGFKKQQTTQSLSKRVVHYGERVPKGGGRYKIGKPYKIGNRWYRPKEEPDYEEVGVASWYGHLFHGRYTANGEIYDMDALTAAHPTLPIPSYVRVTNRENGRTLVLRVNDRGPYANNRIIDLSRYAAKLLGFERKGTASVRVTYLRPAPLNGDDRYEKRFLAQQRWRKGYRRNRRYTSRKRPRYSRRSYASRRYDNIHTSSIPRYNRSRSRLNSTGRYTIQVGAYKNIYNARRMKGRASRHGYAYIRSQNRGYSPLYKVMVGPFNSRYKAERALDRLAYSGIDRAIIINN